MLLQLVLEADDKDRFLITAERRQQAELIRLGCRALMVMCIAEDDKAEV